MGKRIKLYLFFAMLFTAFFTVTAQADWQTTNGNTYYYTSSGKKTTGLAKIGKYTYYFGTDGIMRTGWQSITKKNVTNKYYFNKKTGRMATGVTKIGKKYYLFATNGKLQTNGFNTLNGKTYYSKASGVLAKSQWINNLYYFKKDCTMAVNTTVDGRTIGSDGKATDGGALNGFITSGGNTYYYVNNKKQTGFQTIGGKKYYFTATGVMKTGGWFKVGSYSYYAGKKGVLAASTWIGKKYVLANGTMATGWQQIGTKRYYFSKKGNITTGWKTIKKITYYFDKGVLQTNKWITENGAKYYVTSDGTRASGVVSIGKYKYYFDKSTGKMLTGYFKVGKSAYWARANGRLYVGVIFKVNGYRYYALSTAKLAKGLQQIGGKYYYFSKKTYRMSISKMVKTGGATYYFGSNGAAVTGKWQTIGTKTYYFGSDGKMAVSTTVDGYNVGSDGARTGKASTYTGWKTVSGSKYYYVNGVAATGWKTISGSKYYFNASGVMQTGIQSISGKKYYFYPTGILATGVTIAVGSKEYTITSAGVVSSEKTINVSGSNTGAQIAKYALNFVGNKYVYGGTSLTNGADCSGFVQTLFANYGIKLLRVADDQRKGPSSAQIAAGYKKAVTVSSSSIKPGDLVFYGSSSYASHVGVYIGNGKIVHASNSQAYPAGGIKISAWNYATPIAIVRYWS